MRRTNKIDKIFLDKVWLFWYADAMRFDYTRDYLQQKYPGILTFVRLSEYSMNYVLVFIKGDTRVDAILPFGATEEQLDQIADKAVQKLQADASSLGRFLRGVGESE